jgi:hypothetical protein
LDKREAGSLASRPIARASAAIAAGAPQPQ